MMLKKEFWFSAAFCLVIFAILGQISGWNNFFPFVHCFNALTSIVWSILLYSTLRAPWTQSKCKMAALVLVITALPHTIGSLLSYGSMICLGVSIVGAILFLLKARKLAHTEK